LASTDEGSETRSVAGVSAPFEETLEAAGSSPSQGSSSRELARGAAVGRYIVLSLLGRGGMGEVYAAYDPELDRRVAVKLLHAARRSEGARVRLAREARALAKLSHPNVVQIYDVGEHEGDVFLAMELVPGESFEAWCAGTPRPTWREVLDAYLDAARGLGAAHEKDLVHRDVKPANILRGVDGRVRVADFGIAAGPELAGDPIPGARVSTRAVLAETPDEIALGETLPVASGTNSSNGGPLTQAGSIMGTPLYMAPEQLTGSVGTQASDQYSLCASLHEGLYGVAPHDVGHDKPAETIAELLARKKAWTPSSPPGSSEAPAWVYRAVARGLAPDPHARFASIEDLVTALSHDPDVPVRARRRGWAVGLGVVALVAVAAAGWVRSGAFDDPCKHADRELAGVWDGATRGRVHDALVGTGRSYADGTATRVAARLDAYASSFVAMRGQVCEASRKGVERREVTALRDACLDRRRGQLGALTSVLADKPDPETLDKAVSAADDLPAVAYCADVAALTAPFPPPEDPVARAHVNALEQRVDRLEALETSGKYTEGAALTDALLAETAAAGYPPIDAEARYWSGRLAERAGDYDKAKDLLRQSAASAAAGHDAAGVWLAWARVLFIVGERQRHFAEAAVVASFGPTLSAHVDDVATQAAWLNAEGLFLYRTGKLAEARATHERGLALYEAAYGSDHIAVANSLNNLGLVLEAMGDPARAIEALERANAVFVQVLGPDNPDVATSLNDLGIAYFNSGDYRQAKDDYTRATSIFDKTIGSDAIDGSAAVLNLGNIEFVTGDIEGAKAAYARNLALVEKAFGADHPDAAMAAGNLAEALLNLGEYAAAEAMATHAMEVRAKFFGAASVDVANAQTTIARAEIRMGRLHDAEALLERALAIKEKLLSATDASSSDVLLGWGELRLAEKRPSDAIAYLEKARSIADAYSKPEILLTLADALAATRKDPARARALAVEARADYERLGHAPGLARASRFLATHLAGDAGTATP
jgi:serine/threonine-protein kinase